MNANRSEPYAADMRKRLGIDTPDSVAHRPGNKRGNATMAAAASGGTTVHGTICRSDRPPAADARAMATGDPGGDHLGFHHRRHRRHRRPALSFRLAPQPLAQRRSIRCDPGVAGRAWHSCRRLPHELDRRKIRPPPRDFNVRVSGRRISLAFRTRIELLGSGRIVRAQHHRRRRHRRHPRGVLIRNDRPHGPRQSVAGLPGQHRFGRASASACSPSPGFRRTGNGSSGLARCSRSSCCCLCFGGCCRNRRAGWKPTATPRTPNVS